MPLSLPDLASDLAADSAAIALDLNDGGYDRLHELLERYNILPRTLRGRMALSAALVVAARIAKQRMGPVGPVGNFVNELAGDGVREEAKRILETVMAQHREPSPSATEDKPSVTSRITNGITDFLCPWMPHA